MFVQRSMALLRPESSGSRLAYRAAALGLIVGLAGCVYAPYAPRDPGSLGPPGESEPVTGADLNPLDEPPRVVVVCTPQGTPQVETAETRACEEDPECTVTCESARTD